MEGEDTGCGVLVLSWRQDEQAGRENTTTTQPSMIVTVPGAVVAQEEPTNWKVSGSTPASPGHMSKCPWARH